MPQPDRVIIEAPFSYDEGKCWVVNLAHLPAGDRADTVFPARDQLTLFEDGRPLGPAHQPHFQIRAAGGGQYSHWQQQLYFSTSDGSDPNTNGRVYSVELKPSDERAQFIRNTAVAAKFIVSRWLDTLGPEYIVAGKTMCEIGPGGTLAATLMLMGLGAECIVVDRVPPVWDAEAHPCLIEALCLEGPRLGRPFFPDRLRGCDGGFNLAKVHTGGLEAAGADLRDSADLTVSNSVLEHVADMGSSLHALHGITKPGGVGVHAIDMRDHINFALPLEFLLYSQDEYDALSDKDYRYDRGNRVRPGRLIELLDKTQFFLHRFRGVDECASDYRADIQRRLKRSSSPFKDIADEDLRFLNGMLSLVKAA